MVLSSKIEFCVLCSLRQKLPGDIAVPSSVALPFGTFERTLKEKANSAAARNIASLQKQLVSMLLVGTRV